jgi:YggT family protein
VQIVGLVIALVLQLFLILLFVRFVFDWVQVFARSWSPRGVLLVLLEIVYSATDPPINLVRRFVPPLRIGSIALDLAFIIVLIAVYVLMELNRVVFSL